MPRTPLPPSETGRPGGRPPCPGRGRRPLPDPAAVRLCAVPDTAPPYDDELLASPPYRGLPAVTAGPAGDGGAAETGPAESGRPAESARTGASTGDGAGRPALPGQFAQVLVETLAGSRPPRQMTTWTTERARSRIQRLGPVLSAGQRPCLRRVVAFRPSPDVIEMTLVLSCGPRIRAVAVRLEHLAPRHATPGQQARPGRWFCTDIEAA